MKYLSIILFILICSCNNANQKTQSVPIDTTQNDNEDGVLNTPSVRVCGRGRIDSIINNSGYKLGGSLGCVLWDSIEFNGIGTCASPFHLPSAKLPTVHVTDKGIIDTIYGEGGGVGPFLYLPTTEDTIKELDKGWYDTKGKGIARGDADETIIWSHGGTSKVIRMDLDDLQDSVIHGYHIFSLKLRAKWLWRSYPAYLDSSFNKD